jgi:hypothetical protein
VIIEKAKPPPGSVAVGLHLPALSFHHVSMEMLAQLERLQARSEQSVSTWKDRVL